MTAHASDPERARIASALVSLTAERGFADLDRDLLLARAGLDAAAFKRHFTSTQDCLDRVWAEMANDFIAELRAAYRGSAPWRDRLRASAYFILGYFLADPERTRFFMLGVLEGGPLAEARRDLVMQVGIDIVDGGRSQLPDPESVGRDVADQIVTSIYQSILTEIGEGGGVDALPALVPRLMHDAVGPYLGPEAAAEELTMPPPA